MKKIHSDRVYTQTQYNGNRHRNHKDQDKWTENGNTSRGYVSVYPVLKRKVI